MSFTEHHYKSQDGLPLYFRNYGMAGQAVMCLPGLTRNSKDFHDLALHLAPDFRVICPDLRGRGQSGWDSDWRNYNPAIYIQDLWVLLDHLDIDQVIVIGTSLGGLLAMIMASQRTDAVRAVVLNDAGPEVNPAGYTRILASASRQVEVENWPDAVRQCRDNYSIALPGQGEEFWERFARQSYRQGNDGRPVLDLDPKIGQAIREGDLQRLAGVHVDPWEAFAGISQPCLVLRGELSDILSEEIVERMSQVKADLEREVIPQRGHAPLLNEPAALRVIDNFLNRCTAD